MAVWDDLTKSLGGSWISNVLVGTAVILVTPIVAPAALALLRPLAKTIIKGGVVAYDKTSEMMAEASEQLSDLVAEVRADLAASAAATAAGPTVQRPQAAWDEPRD
jgi:hypothetical protein